MFTLCIHFTWTIYITVLLYITVSSAALYLLIVKSVQHP